MRILISGCGGRPGNASRRENSLALGPLGRRETDCDEHDEDRNSGKQDAHGERNMGHGVSPVRWRLNQVERTWGDTPILRWEGLLRHS